MLYVLEIQCSVPIADDETGEGRYYCCLPMVLCRLVYHRQNSMVGCFLKRSSSLSIGLQTASLLIFINPGSKRALPAHKPRSSARQQVSCHTPPNNLLEAVFFPFKSTNSHICRSAEHPATPAESLSQLRRRKKRTWADMF